jgi:ABC-2 type transport system ATP-binding protein
MDPSPSPVLELQDLGFAYPGEPALFEHWSTTLGAGVTLLHGDTGSGKTTLLKLMAGVLPATGRLTLGGTRLELDPHAYRRKSFWCDPVSDAFEQVTARACTAALVAGDGAFDATAWESLAQGFALTPHLDKPMFMLSTGSKRKVFLAAALTSGRPLVLLDEPTSALDAPSIAHLMKRLGVLAGQRDCAVVIASYDRPPAIAFSDVIELPIARG